MQKAFPLQLHIEDPEKTPGMGLAPGFSNQFEDAVSVHIGISDFFTEPFGILPFHLTKLDIHNKTGI